MEKRSIVLTVVVLAMLFTGMFLYLFTKGELQQARLPVEEETLVGEVPGEVTEEAAEAIAEESEEVKEGQVAAVVGVRETADNATEPTEGTQDNPVDVTPTAATGATSDVALAAGLSILLGLFGLVRVYRRQLKLVC